MDIEQRHEAHRAQHKPLYQSMSISINNTAHNQPIAPLYGLVLAGGHSQRMGTDKGLLHYHGKPQREWVADLLALHCSSVWVSCRPEQAHSISPPYQALPDRWPNAGPMGALLTAFEHAPEAAWLIVACDLPLLDADGLAELVHQRAINADATAFLNPDIEAPDPVLSIWEPPAHARVQAAYQARQTSLLRVLRAAHTHLITPSRPAILHNANTPAEKEALTQQVRTKR